MVGLLQASHPRRHHHLAHRPGWLSTLGLDASCQRRRRQFLEHRRLPPPPLARDGAASQHRLSLAPDDPAQLRQCHPGYSGRAEDPLGVGWEAARSPPLPDMSSGNSDLRCLGVLLDRRPLHFQRH